MWNDCSLEIKYNKGGKSYKIGKYDGQVDFSLVGWVQTLWSRCFCEGNGKILQRGNPAMDYNPPGGVLPIMAYTGGLRPKVVPFSGVSGIWKGTEGFYLLKYIKG